jgi:hypothetical protein
MSNIQINNSRNNTTKEGMIMIVEEGNSHMTNMATEEAIDHTMITREEITINLDVKTLLN